MILEETQICIFHNNLIKATGRGPIKEIRDAKDRVQQVHVAEDFANILYNEEDVLLEAEEGLNPTGYIQNSGRHRAPPPKRNVNPDKKTKNPRKHLATKKKTVPDEKHRRNA